jgi:hypothetical protein
MQSFVSVSRAFGLGLVLLGLAACASSTSDGLMADEKHPQDVICRNEPNTGSRLPKKTCRTRAEWEAIAAASAELGRSLQRDSVGGSITDGSRQ